MSDLGSALDTGNKLIDLIERTMGLVTGNASYRKIGKHLRSEISEIAGDFETLARQYFEAILGFQGAVERSASFDEIGDAIVVLRQKKYPLIFDRHRLAGKRRAFRTFIHDHEHHRARTLMVQLEGFSQACDLFFFCSEYNGIPSESWATALEELAKGYDNHTNIEVDALGHLPAAKAAILAGTGDALRQMAESQNRLSAVATELKESLRFWF